MNLLKRLLASLFGSSAPSAPPDQPITPTPAVPPRIESTTAPALAPPPLPPPKKAGRSFGLDAADYLPITREEIKQAARGRSLIGSLWFGRRDLIPPADDPRTQLIDRGMVTQGLITPEQLAE